MNRIKALIRSFFGFSRSETNGFLILLPLIFIIIFSEPIYRAWFTRQPLDYSQETKTLDSLVAEWKWDTPDSSTKKNSGRPDKNITLFRFNPNQSNLEQLQSLGLSEFMAKRILNYHSKGGTFRIKSDLKKIYGIDSIWYKRVYAYIDLPEKLFEKNEANEKLSIIKKESLTFNLNQADTSQLMKIYGIGPKLAIRIIKYRERLGGFIDLAQLKQVYGLDSTVIGNLSKKCFIAQDFKPKTLDINQATEAELAGHPYLTRQMAKSIATYRFQHGPFQSIDDLTKIKSFTTEAVQKMKPYFTLELPREGNK